MNEIISVIMSTYNESKSDISKAIESIINQTYNNYEFIIIIDNPYNEELKQIIKYYSNKDDRIKIIINNENIGLANSLNKGINISKGRYIARMDADDISDINRLEKQLKFLKNNNFDMVSSNRIDIDENNEVLSEKSKLPNHKNIKKLLPIGNFITHPSVLIRADVIKNLGGYRNFPSSQDYDLWLRVLSHNYKIGIIDEPLIYYRIRQNSISNKDKYKQYLIKKYQQELYKIRIKNNNVDNFTEDNLEEFLIKNRYYLEKEKFNKADLRMSESIRYIKNKRIIKGFINLIYSFIQHREIRRDIFATLKYKLLSISM